MLELIFLAVCGIGVLLLMTMLLVWECSRELKTIRRIAQYQDRRQQGREEATPPLDNAGRYL